MKRFVFTVLVIFPVILVCLAGRVFPGSIKHTRHNLSSGSPLGGIRARDTSNICIFCHTSHAGNTQAPLWNREDSRVVYNLYDSSTLYSKPDQPDGASKLCLSCHDGTIALGKMVSHNKEFAMFDTNMGRMEPTWAATFLTIIRSPLTLPRQ